MELVKDLVTALRSVEIHTATHIYIYIYMCIYNAMEETSLWEANMSSATQEIPRILGNPKIQCYVQKSPTEPDPVHASSHFLESILILSFISFTRARHLFLI